MSRYCLAMVLAFAPAAANGQEIASPPPAASVEIARHVLAQVHTDRLVDFMVQKLAPVFAAQVLNKIGTDPEAKAAFSPYLQKPNGNQRVRSALADAYTKAFTAHLPEMLSALAERYARALSIEDLRSLSAFLDRPVGKRWADAGVSLQQASGDEGARVGGIAGAQAVAAALEALAAGEKAK